MVLKMDWGKLNIMNNLVETQKKSLVKLTCSVIEFVMIWSFLSWKRAWKEVRHVKYLGWVVFPCTSWLRLNSHHWHAVSFLSLFNKSSSTKRSIIPLILSENLLNKLCSRLFLDPFTAQSGVLVLWYMSLWLFILLMNHFVSLSLLHITDLWSLEICGPKVTVFIVSSATSLFKLLFTNK